MVFGNLIKWKLLLLLQPWLREEPQLELKLGIINSQATVKNLSFDCSVLNNLIDGPTRCYFDEVTVDELSVSFSNWNAPAFRVIVSGIHVTLSVEWVKIFEKFHSCSVNFVYTFKLFQALCIILHRFGLFKLIFIWVGFNLCNYFCVWWAEKCTCSYLFVVPADNLSLCMYFCPIIVSEIFCLFEET